MTDLNTELAVPNEAVPDDAILDDIIKSLMETLHKTVLWIIFSLTILAISIYGTPAPGPENKKAENILEIFGLKIPRDFANILIFALLFVISYYMYKLFRNVRDNYAILGNKKKSTLLLRRHPFIGNPFSVTGKRILFFDYLGYMMLFILWWSGLWLGIRMMQAVQNYVQLFICFIFAVLYCAVGLYSRRVINHTLAALNAEDKVTDSLNWKSWKTFCCACATIGFIVFFNLDLCWSRLLHLPFTGPD